MLHSLRHLVLLCAERSGNPPDRLGFSVIIRQGAGPAEHGDTDAALVPLRMGQLNHPDLPRFFHMGSTAGADIKARNRHNADPPFDLDLAAVFQSGQLLPGRIRNLDIQIGCGGFICPKLDLMQLFPGDLPVKVHGAVCTAQVKPHIVVSKAGMHQPGNNMLPGMLLHLHKTLRPVDLPGHRAPGRNRPVRDVENFSVTLLHIQHPDNFRILLKLPGICVLSSPFRKKRGPVEHNLISLFFRNLPGPAGRFRISFSLPGICRLSGGFRSTFSNRAAFQHNRRKRPHMAVFVK